MQEQQRRFNPNDHLMQLKSKNGSQDYLEVKWRLVWFRDQCPEGEIVTEVVHLDLDRDTEEEVYVWNNEKRRSEKVVKTAKGIAIFRATVKDGKGGLATGTKSEKAASFPDFIEKAESGSIGRALAALGYGTQFTGNELSEDHRIVDSPVGSAETSQGSRTSTPTEEVAPKERLTELGRAMRTKGLVAQNASLIDVLKECGTILDANITAIGHMTESRFETVETYVRNAKPQLAAVR